MRVPRWNFDKLCRNFRVSFVVVLFLCVIIVTDQFLAGHWFGEKQLSDM